VTTDTQPDANKPPPPPPVDTSADQETPSQRARALSSNGDRALHAYAVAELPAPPLRPTVEMERVHVTDPRMRPTLPAVRRAALPPSAPPTGAERAEPSVAPRSRRGAIAVAAAALLAIAAGVYVGVARRHEGNSRPLPTDRGAPGAPPVALVPDPVAAAAGDGDPRDVRPEARAAGASAPSAKARAGAPATTSDPGSAGPRPVPVTPPPAPSSHRIFGVED
jgi:hypothetical protein